MPHQQAAAREIGEDFVHAVLKAIAAGQLVQILDAHAVNLLRALAHLVHGEIHILARDGPVLDHQIGELADLAGREIGRFRVKADYLHMFLASAAYAMVSSMARETS